MAKPATKIKVRVQRFVATTIDHIKINGNVWWPQRAISTVSKQYETISDISKPVLLFVHQWSKMGGAGSLMENMAYNMAIKNQYTSITFDMRGVNKSTGSSTWSGHNEVNDILCVTEWIKLNIAKPIIIIGSSAGAPIAGSAFGDINYPYIIGGIFIGYPFGFWSSIIFGKHYNKIIQSEKPKLFVQGDSDGFTSVSTLQGYVEKCKGDINEIYIEKDIGHFGLESPQFDLMICELIHQFVTEKVSKNVDIKLWHQRLDGMGDDEDNDNDDNKEQEEDQVEEKEIVNEDGNEGDDEEEEEEEEEQEYVEDSNENNKNNNDSKNV